LEPGLVAESKLVLYESDTGHKFGPASDKDLEAFLRAQGEGKGYFLRGYHGYQLKMTVRYE